MWRKFRIKFSLKINWTFGKKEEILKGLSLYDKSKMSYKKHDINRNALSKFAEKIRFHMIRNWRVRASLSAAVIPFLKRVSCSEMNGGNHC